MQIRRCARHQKKATGRFRRELLPSPRSFYGQEFGSALGRERRSWVQVKCAFHEGKSKASLALNMETGAFRCFSPSCGAHGGDLIAFVRVRYNLDFSSACRYLGAWDEAGMSLRSVVMGRDLVMGYAINGTEYTARVKDDPRDFDFAGLLRRVRANACDRLTEIGNGDEEKFDGEAELEWQIAADCHQLIRDEELAHG